MPWRRQGGGPVPWVAHVPPRAGRAGGALGWPPVLDWALVFLGGAAGALCRFVGAGWVAGRTGGERPWGTLAVNLLGCFLIGVVGGAAHPLGHRWLLLLEVGFIGAFTTFSSLAYETVRLLEEGLAWDALLNPLVSLAGGLLLAFLGTALGASLP
jgi:CrcB protein